MNIFIIGGTGFIGSSLIKKLTERGNQLTVLTRSREKCDKLRKGVSFIEGDPTQPGDWQNHVKRHDCLINLAGAPILSRWSEKRKRIIRESRIFSTRHLVDAIDQDRGGKKTLFCASGVGYYGFHDDRDFYEEMSPGNDFLANLAKDWEDEAMRASQKGVRVVVMRFGMVLGRNGGALGHLVPLFRYCLGGPLGDGNQWISWIHMEDLVEAFIFLVKNPGISGPVNFTSPNPLRNKDLVKALAKALHRPASLPVPGFGLRLIWGELASVLLNGQRAYPKKLLENGFTFSFPEIDRALADLIGN